MQYPKDDKDMIFKTEEMMEHEIRSFNGLAEKHDHKFRLKYIPDQPMFSGILILGTPEQLEYDASQAVLAYGVVDAYAVASSLRIYHCAEFGE